MRIRTIKPEFWQSESIGRLSRPARLLYIGLFSACDDSGRTRAASRLLASLLFPYDDDALKHIDCWMEELEREGCVRRYIVDDNTYLEIPKWREHQKIDKPSASKFPPFDEASRVLPEASRSVVVGSGIREQGSGNRDQGSLAPPPAGVDARRREIQRNPVTDALAVVGGGKVEEVTNWKPAGIARAAIIKVTPQVTPEEIRRRAANYRTHFDGAALTPTALAKHWAVCANPKPRATIGADQIERERAESGGKFSWEKEGGF
jgi:hypothetical protein